MNDEQLHTLAQMQAFLDGTVAVEGLGCYRISPSQPVNQSCTSNLNSRYKFMVIPYEKLKSLPKPKQFLKPDVTFEHLEAQAMAMNENEAAMTEQRTHDSLQNHF